MNNNISTACSQNAVIVRELLKFCRAARSSGDSRLGMTYSKAINSIRAHTQPILNGQQATQLNGVGNFIAGKIDEILDFERSFQADFANQSSAQPQTFIANPNQQPIFQQANAPNDPSTISSLRNSGNGVGTYIASYPQSVADWLRELDFLCYLDGFLEAGYDNLLVCEQLTEIDLEHIKCVTKPGHRKTLLVASQELHQRRKTREMNGFPAIPVPRNSNSPPSQTSVSTHQNHSEPLKNSASPPTANSLNQDCDVSSLPIPKVVRTRNGGVIPKVTEDFIRSNSSDASYERGKQLFQNRGVLSLIIDGEQLKSEVQGSTPHDSSYKILLEVNLQREKVASGTCSCPYDQEGWCKHIVATLCALQNSQEDCHNSQTSSQPDVPRDISPTVARRNIEVSTSNYNDYFTSTVPQTSSNNACTTTTNANVTKKPRKNPPAKQNTTNDATQSCNNNTTDNDNNTSTKSKPLDKTKVPKPYRPTFRSGGWAIMIALYEASLADDYPGYLLKSTLIEKASPLANDSFEKGTNSWYTAWNSMKTLRTKGLVLKQKSPAQYSLTEEGIIMAKELYENKNAPQKQIDLRKMSPKKSQPHRPSIISSNSTPTTLNTTSVDDTPSQDLDISNVVPMDIRDETRVPLSPRTGTQMDSDEEPLILNLKRNNNNANIANNNSNTITNKKRLLPDSNKENQNPIHALTFRDNIIALDSHNNITPTDSYDNINLVDLNSDRDPSANSQYKIEVVLLLDNREIKKDDNRNLYKGLCHHGISCEKRNLELGDVLWIVKRTLGTFCEEVVLNYILERKKISDLFASLEDGRYTEQKFRLKKSGLKNPIYLIEGNSGLLERADVVENALMQTHLEGFFIQRTASEEETLQYLILVTRQLEDFYKRKRERQLGLSASTSYGRLTSPETCFTFQEFSNQVSKSKNLSLSDLFAKQLLQLPHCTPEKVSEIIKLYPTPRLLLEAYKKEPQKDRVDMLKNMEFGGPSKRRKFGALSKTIADFYVGDYVSDLL